MTKRSSILSKLQTIFGVTKSELIIVLIILGGLLTGIVVKSLTGNQPGHIENADEIYTLLDSLAEARRTTYTGTDIRNNPFPDLAAGDTVVKKEAIYPSPVKPKLKPGESININTASKVQLMKLPGIGESYAVRILDYRNSCPFRKPEDIMKIKGIGKKKFEKLKPFIIVE